MLLSLASLMQMYSKNLYLIYNHNWYTIFSFCKDRQSLKLRKKNPALKMIPVQTMIMSPSKRKMIPRTMLAIQMRNLQKDQKLRLKRIHRKILVRIATLIQIRRKCQLPICPKPVALQNRKNDFCIDAEWLQGHPWQNVVK